MIGEILGRPFLLLASTIAGILIGVLPAIGGGAANMMAYAKAKKFSHGPELNYALPADASAVERRPDRD
ncbi:tripartite tricarboxylate transporter permease [Bradyrhizobium sp. NAS80.1]|uniref:tripartite tricarboxylate transporter permease n=1 Tax=Bradyrhizobium sp. NAS80.1 TaxID=1680159 RepID=UPI00143E06F2|nr:tripartite tricarboxylate transporter permease [Bradyrhizobium sp. NAS80.1]